MIKDIWNSIDQIIDPNKINYDKLTQIEKSIINCDYDTVCEKIKINETNYYQNFLCNGHYQKKYDNLHPDNCHHFICYKTLTYYALWINCYYYSNIFILILNIIDSDTSFHFNTNIEKFKHVSSLLKTIYDLLIDTTCSCSSTKNYMIFYNDKSFNFKKINDSFGSILTELINSLEMMYGENNQKIENDCNMIMPCHKEFLGKNYFNNTEQNKSVSNDKNIQNLSSIVFKLKCFADKYETSSKIVKYLFNQQAIEYYQYNILTKSFKLESIIDEIFNNEYIDVNYLTSDNENFFSITLMKQNKIDLIEKIKNLNGKMPEKYTIQNIIPRCNIENLKKFIKIADNDFLGDTDELVIFLLQYEKMISSDKLEIIDILLKRGLFDDSIKLIQLCIKNDKSFSLLEKLVQRKKVIDRVSSFDINSCIKLMKYRELELLLSSNPKLINDKYENHTPIMHFFMETTKDSLSEKLILKTLLAQNPNIEIINETGDTPLLLALKNNRQESFNLLFSSCANPFYMDSDGHNALHIAIINNNINAINMMKHRVDNKKYIINEKTKNTKKYPLVLAIEGKNPIEICQILINDENINLNIKINPDDGITDEENGNNIMHFIINSNISTRIKNILFKMFLDKNLDLLEQSKKYMKPLVVCAVEKDLYKIIVMIMNKLLQNNEISFDGYDGIDNIEKLVDDNKQKNVIMKDKFSTNFYSLVMVYLKNNKDYKDNKIGDSFCNSITIAFFYVFLFISIKNIQ